MNLINSNCDQYQTIAFGWCSPSIEEDTKFESPPLEYGNTPDWLAYADLKYHKCLSKREGT